MNKAALVDEVQKLMGAGSTKAAAERATDAVLTKVDPNDWTAGT